MSQHFQRQAKKFKKGWILIACICGSIALFHKPLLVLGCRAYLSKKSVSYTKMGWEQGVLAITGLQIKDPGAEVAIDRIELKFGGDPLHLVFQPQIVVFHPQVVLAPGTNQGAPALPFLYRNRFFRPQWDVKNGVVQLASLSRLYFSMSPGIEKNEIGQVLISHSADPQMPAAFSADLAMRGKKLQVGFKLHQTDLSRLVPLVGQDAVSAWQRTEGELEAEGMIAFNRSFKIEELHCRAMGRSVDLFAPALGVDVTCEEFETSFSYPVAEAQGAFWDRISASLFLKSGACHFSAPLAQSSFGMDRLNGELKFEPQEEPHATLSGMFVREEQQMPFTLAGKGGVQEDGTFWSEVEMKCRSMQSLLSFYTQENDEMSLHLKVDGATFEHIDFLRRFTNLPGQCVEGLAQAEATLHYSEGKWQKASVENCRLEKACWYFPERQMSVCSDEIVGDCSAVLNEGGWNLDELHLSMQEGNYLDPRMQLERLYATIAFEKGVLLPSQLKGEWGELLAEIDLEGNRAQAKLRGNAGQVIGLLVGTSTSLPITAQAAAKWEKGILSVDTEAEIAGEAVKGSAVFDGMQWKEAVVQAEKITEKSYGALLPLFLSDIGLTGNLQCQVNMTPGRAQVQFGGEGLVVHHALAELSIPQLKTNGARLVFEKEWRGEVPLVDASLHYLANDLRFENIEGALKFAGDRLQSHSFYAECEGLALRGNAELTFADQRLMLTTAQIAGDTTALQNVLKHFPAVPQGSVPIVGNFSSGDGGFVLNAPLAAGEAEWSFRGSFDALQFPVNAGTSIDEGSCEISFDSKKQQLILEKGEGTWKLMDGMPLTVQLKRGIIDAGMIDCSLKVVDGRKEFASIEAKAVKTPSGNWDVAFDKAATHFGGLKPNITRCALNNEMQIAGFEMQPTLRAQDFAGQIALFQNAGFLSAEYSAKSVQELQLEGTVQAQLATEDLSQGFSLQAESRDLKVKGEPCATFQLKARKTQEKWQIERLEAGGLFLKGVFAATAAGISSPQFEGSWQGIQMKGSGYLKSAEKRFSCSFESLKGDLALLNLPTVKGTFVAGAKITGDLSAALQLAGEVNLYADLQGPLALSLSSVKSVRFNYSEVGGLICEGVDVQCKHKTSGAFLANLQATRIAKGKDSFSAQQVQYSFSPAFLGFAIDGKLIASACKELEWEGNLEGSGELSSSGVFQGTLKPGRYGYAGKSLPFEQLQVRYEKELLTVRAKTHIEEEPLWGALQLAFNKEMSGALKLFDNPKSDGLKLLFNAQAGNFAWESIQGSCYGLSCNLTKSSKRKVPQATVLTGEVKVDGGRLIPLFPKEVREGLQTIKFGSGYEWKGDLVLWQEAKRGFQANGALLGTDFEALGYKFRRLEGTLDATPEHIVINNIAIDDPSGVISIQKIELDKKNDWHLYIPQILVQKLHPSLMQKIGVEAQPLKPFMINQFTLSDIRGKLGDKSSLEGSGRLHFSNQFKKESSIFDAPIEMLKKIGLDPGLLTPVQGELEMELRGDKFYLLSLLDSHSEGSRAEFYLAPDKELSYIDLDGKMHIDLKMRQDVMLKITEPFTLTIRGTLEKPRYGLQY